MIKHDKCAPFEDEISRLKEDLIFALKIANWDNIDRNETERLIALYRANGLMESDGTLK
jgi:hypothetical protein